MRASPFARLLLIWEKRPLSTQLVTLITALLALGLVMSGTVMVGLLQRHLVSQVDEQLVSAAESMLYTDDAAMETGEAGLPTLYFIRRTFIGSEPPLYYYYPETLAISGTPDIPDLLTNEDALDEGL